MALLSYHGYNSYDNNMHPTHVWLLYNNSMLEMITLLELLNACLMDHVLRQNQELWLVNFPHTVFRYPNLNTYVAIS